MINTEIKIKKSILFGLVLLLSIGCLKAQNPKKTTNTFIPAEFPGGMDSLTSFLSTRLKPMTDSLANIGENGKVIIIFIVNSTGTHSDFRILESFNSDVDGKVLEILKGMPPWIPATNKGKAIKCALQLPIKFEIKYIGRNRKNTNIK